MNSLRLVRLIFSFIILFFIIHTAVTVSDGLTDEGKSADVALILGSKVNVDGSLSTRLSERLQCGLVLFRTGRVKKLIVSGGFGKEGFFEGNKMKDFLREHEVPDSCIVVDNFGNNTVASVDNALKLKDSLHFNSLIAVSQYFHLTRTKKLFRNRHFDNVSSVSPKYFEARDLYSLFREFIAYYLEG